MGQNNEAMECGAAARANFGFRWLSTATHGMRGPQLDDPIWTLPNATNMLPPPAFVAPTIAKPLTAAIPSRLGFPGIADTAIPIDKPVLGASWFLVDQK